MSETAEQTETTPKPCPACKGTGKQCGPNHEFKNGDFHFVKQDCVRCNGSGKAPSQSKPQ